MTALASETPKAFPIRPHPNLYEINTWAWLEQLSARLGRTIRLADVPDSEWDALAHKGFDIVWLMGVWRRSRQSCRIALADPANPPQYDRALPGWKPDDVIGSPYAIARYIPDARMGGWKGVDLAREKLRARGMALFLDFVGNHTALDHPWVRKHPQYYVQGTQQDFEKDPASFYPAKASAGTAYIALGRDPYFPPWKDTAQLNYFEPQLRAAQIAELRCIAKHCDGVRCDMAMLQLNDIFAKIWTPLLRGAEPPKTEFWADAHAALPSLILLAEAYWGTEPRLIDLGFSFVYDKPLYDAVRDLRMAEVHTRVEARSSYQSCLARYLENHDEARCASVFGPQFPAAGVLMGTLPGLRFYHQGELEGRRIHLPITLRIAADEPPNPPAAAFFEKILPITAEDAFHQGQWSVLPVTPEGDGTSANLVVYEWRLEKVWKVIVVNLSAGASQGRVHFGENVSPGQSYIFYDGLDDVRYIRGGDEMVNLGLFVRRDAFQAHLFDVAQA
ncbi:MAG: hypothetical protein WA405_08400 [Candidatus Acidiferrales bacterium]